MFISLAAEKVATLGTWQITNSMLGTLLVDLVLIATALGVNFSGIRKVPGKLQNMVEFVMEIFLELAESVAHRKALIFFPLVFTFFLFIIFSNWLALLPGFSAITVSEGEKVIPLFRSPSADLNVTLALGLISVGVVQFFGLKYLGLSYLKKYINFAGPIDFFVGILELILEFAKVISFGFRLFGNIFAGEVLLIVAGSLLPFLSPIPILGMELFVGMIQALVFAVLSLVFLSMSVEKTH